jgi:hypothetical protein
MNNAILEAGKELLPEPCFVRRNLRPLYFGPNGVLYCSRFDRIYATDDFGRTLHEAGRLENHFRIRPMLAQVPLAQRALRTQIYRMRVLSDGTKIYIFRKGVYTQGPADKVAIRTFSVPRGSRPVSLAVSRDGLVVFGEYWDNAERAEVHVYGSNDSGKSWAPVYTFPARSIRHVHGISYDPWDDCFWLCTGDYQDENQLMRASTDFKNVRLLRQGGQGNRFYYLLVLEKDLLTATDAPAEQNHVCIINKESGELTRVAEIENTNFYSCRVGNKVFLSTNAEPSAVNDTRRVHVWMGDLETGGWRKLWTNPIDRYAQLCRWPGVPRGLFQYSSVFFPEGDNPSETLVCYGLGVRGYDNALFCYDVRSWDV